MMDASTDISNDSGKTVEDLAPEVAGQSLLDMRRHAMVTVTFIITRRMFCLIQSWLLCRNI